MLTFCIPCKTKKKKEKKGWLGSRRILFSYELYVVVLVRTKLSKNHTACDNFLEEYIKEASLFSFGLVI